MSSNESRSSQWRARLAARSGGLGAFAGRSRSLWLRLSLGATRRAEASFLLTLGVVGLVLAAGVGGSFTPVNGRLFGLLCLLAVAVLALRGRSVPWQIWTLAAAGVAVTLLDAQPVVWLGGFAVSFSALGLVKGRLRGHLLALALGAAAAAVLLSAASAVPRLWLWINGLSLAVSRGYGLLAGEPLRLGAAATGVWPLLVVACVVAAQLLLRRPAHGRTLLSLLALLAAAVTFLVLVDRVPAGLRQSAYEVFKRQWLAGLLASPAVWIAAGGRLRPPAERPRALRLAAAGTLALALFFLGWAPPAAPAAGRRVLLLNEGFVDWKTPVYGTYGPYNTGLFGQLPDYLRLAGLEPRVRSGPLTPQILQGTDVLVVINPLRSWAPQELEAVWSFVRGGGGLLVLGDHTDIMGSQKSLDDLLRPAGISFLFDSGFPAREGWWHSLMPLRHPTAVAIRQSTDALISVGATLALQAPAYPVVTGRYGFSDLGNRLNPQGAFLGDYIYQKGEQLGDVVLVAAARIGKGRVVAFGDTSTLQNAALALSFEPFVVPIFRWVADPGAVHPRGLAAGLALLAVALFSLVAGSGARGAALLGVAVALGSGVALRASDPGLLRITGGKVAWVDLSHNERVSLAALQDDGVGAVMATLSRSRYQPLVVRRFDPSQLPGGRLFLTIAPARRFKEWEVDALESFARSGGLVVVATGWKDRYGSEPLLSRFGIEVAPVPLGPVPVVREDAALLMQKPVFIEAWGMNIRPGPIGRQEELAFVPASQADPIAPALPGMSPDPFEIGASDATQVFYQVEDFPLVLFRGLGAGGLLAFGDSKFLGDGNLENLKFHREGNILLLRDVLQLSEAWGG